jgi:hypothetical protein
VSVDDERTTVDQAMDVLVYAPLGLVLEARTLLPRLATRGRQQVTMAKMVGQFAVKQGQRGAGKAVTKAQAQASMLLTDLGFKPPATPAGPPPMTDPPPAAAEVPRAQSGDGATDLAIADYDSLAASQVIPRLLALSADELEAVRTYEAEHRGRKTVLTKISQLQSA